MPICWSGPSYNTGKYTPELRPPKYLEWDGDKYKIDRCKLDKDPSGLCIYMEVTTKCNLRCKFCFNKNNKSVSQRTNRYRKIGIIVEKLKSQGHDIKLLFAGGEPALNMPFMRRIIKDHVGINEGRSVSFAVATNGLNIRKMDTVGLLRCTDEPWRPHLDFVLLNRPDYRDSRLKRICGKVTPLNKGVIEGLATGSYPKITMVCILGNNGIHTLSELIKYIDYYSENYGVRRYSFRSNIVSKSNKLLDKLHKEYRVRYEYEIEKLRDASIVYESKRETSRCYCHRYDNFFGVWNSKESISVEFKGEKLGKNSKVLSELRINISGNLIINGKEYIV